MPCWPVFHLPPWHRSNESCTQLHAPFWISSRVTVWLQLIESCTGCHSLRGSSTSCACWFTRRFWDTRRSNLLTLVANIPGRSTLRASSCGYLVVLRTGRRIGDRAFSVAAPRAWNRLPTELKLLRWTDSFCLDLKTVYGHQDTAWLWCALGLLVGSTIQVPQLQLQLLVDKDWEYCRVDFFLWQYCRDSLCSTQVHSPGLKKLTLSQNVQACYCDILWHQSTVQIIVQLLWRYISESVCSIFHSSNADSELNQHEAV